MATSTVLYNLTIRAGRDKTNDELFSGPDHPHLKRMKSLAIPGLVVYVKDPNKKGKLDDKSIKCILLGYADHHTADTYRLYNPQTRSILLSRNVRVAPFHGGIKPQDGMENAIQIDDDDEDELTQQPATQQSATQQSTDNNAEHEEATQ